MRLGLPSPCAVRPAPFKKTRLPIQFVIEPQVIRSTKLKSDRYGKEAGIHQRIVYPFHAAREGAQEGMGRPDEQEAGRDGGTHPPGQGVPLPGFGMTAMRRLDVGTINILLYGGNRDEDAELTNFT